MKRKLIVAGVVVLVASALFYRWAWKEEYSGRVQAEAVSLALGPNAIKSLLVELYATNTPAEFVWINKKAEIRNWVMSKFSDSYQYISPEADPNYAQQRNFAAMWGLRALGQPGLSVLTGYFYNATVDRTHAHHAAYVLSLHPEGIAYLLPALGDADPPKRMMALAGLGDATTTDPPRTNASVLVPKLFEILAGDSDMKERVFAAGLLVQWAHPQLHIVSPDQVAEALIRQVPENIDVAVLYGQLRGLAKSETLNAANSNQVMRLVDDHDAAIKARYGKTDSAVDAAFRTKYGK